MDKWDASFIISVNPSSGLGCPHCFSRFAVLSVSGRAQSPTCPPASRETIILLLIHLSLHCSPNQSPVEWDVAKLRLPSCGCPGNRDSVSFFFFFFLLWTRCGAAVWAGTRLTLVGNNGRHGDERSAKADTCNICTHVEHTVWQGAWFNDDLIYHYQNNINMIF